MEVPPAFAAINSETGQCGALIEWFYTDTAELFVHGGDFMQQIRVDFDRTKGKQHNLLDVEVLMRSFARIVPGVRQDWSRWWARALLFDALIGNTDRHQDNWGIIFKRLNSDKQLEVATMRLAPLFDNGTSLGHERFCERVACWTDENFDTYVSKGMHHIRWNLNESPPTRQHFGLLNRVLNEWADFVDVESLREAINFDGDELNHTIEDLTQLSIEVPLSIDRMLFATRLLQLRHNKLKELLDYSTSPRRRA